MGKTTSLGIWLFLVLGAGSFIWHEYRLLFGTLSFVVLLAAWATELFWNKRVPSLATMSGRQTINVGSLHLSSGVLWAFDNWSKTNIKIIPAPPAKYEVAVTYSTEGDIKIPYALVVRCCSDQRAGLPIEKHEIAVDTGVVILADSHFAEGELSVESLRSRIQGMLENDGQKEKWFWLLGHDQVQRGFVCVTGLGDAIYDVICCQDIHGRFEIRFKFD